MPAAANDPGAASGVLAPPSCAVPSGTARRSSLRFPLSLPGSFASLGMVYPDRRLHLPLLAQRLVEDDGHRGGEVEAPNVLARERDAEGGLGVRAADGGGEAAALAPEDEEVVGAEAHRGVRARGSRREAEEPARRARGEERLPARVPGEPHVRPVIEAGAAEMAVVDREPERIDQVERRGGGGAEAAGPAGGLPGLGRDPDDVPGGGTALGRPPPRRAGRA